MIAFPQFADARPSLATRPCISRSLKDLVRIRQLMKGHVSHKGAWCVRAASVRLGNQLSERNSNMACSNYASGWEAGSFVINIFIQISNFTRRFSRSFRILRAFEQLQSETESTFFGLLIVF